ncbi:hypothetical protein FRB95_003292 [Tulasnella sp. JGI-2019a]|nr:hypothetical protein FRB95_003292 [Tulasnella sp. JGI-2019a]
MNSDGLSISGGNPSPPPDARESADSQFDAWDNIARTQGDMFKECVRKNAMLQAEVTKLREELEVWKIGFNSKTKEKEEAEAKALKLERGLTAVHEDNPLIICLIDGDGAIFSDSFLNRGREGGRDAAAALNAGLKSYLESYNATLSNHDNRSKTDDMNGFSTSRIMSPQIVCTIYFNRMGLCNTLQANTVCTSQRFLDFFVGFNQASPLYTLVDVGDGKEAADAKLRESLKLHARLPQTRKVIFGGAHDNGYMPTLISLATEGHLDKLVILKGSANMAHEIDRFRSQAAVDLITIPGLFLQKKLVSPSFLQPTMSPNPFSMPLFAQPNLSYITPNETGSSTPERQNTPAKQPSPTKTAQRAPRSKRDDASSSNRTTTPTTTVSSPPPTSDGKHVLPGLSSQGMPSPVHRLDPKKSFGKQVPPPCNVFYLGRTKCKSDAVGLASIVIFSYQL